MGVCLSRAHCFELPVHQTTLRHRSTGRRRAGLGHLSCLSGRRIEAVLNTRARQNTQDKFFQVKSRMSPFCDHADKQKHILLPLSPNKPTPPTP